jgi:hypothetical protein
MQFSRKTDHRVILNTWNSPHCLHVVCESDCGRYQTCYMQNHALLMPLVNDNTLSKHGKKVAESGLSLPHFIS